MNIKQLSILSILLVLLQCGGSGKVTLQEDKVNQSLPEVNLDVTRVSSDFETQFINENLDITRTEAAFNFKTLLPSDLNLKLSLYDLTDMSPAQLADLKMHQVESSLQPNAKIDATIIIKKADTGTLLFAAKTNSTGELSAKLQSASHGQNVILEIHKNGYHKRSIVIENLGQYSSVNRSLGLAQTQASLQNDLADSDGDMIADVYDAFPNDGSRAFQFSVPADDSLTVAFEDNYPKLGDGDYNDFIARYRLTHVTNAQNQVVELKGSALAIARLAGYNHRFGLVINFPGASGNLTLNYKNELGADINNSSQVVTDSANAVLFESTRDSFNAGRGFSTAFSISFDQPVDAGDIDQAPFDPYLFIHNTGYDVHLLGRPSLPGSNNPPGSDGFRDGNGFPRGLLVPINWAYPKERTFIEQAYDGFNPWRTSFGQTDSDWYLTPNPNKTISIGASNLILASVGGRVAIDGEIEIIIPPGALAADTVISIVPLEKKTENINYPLPLRLAGQRYEVLPSGLQFQNAATMIFHYDENEFSGFDENKLFIASSTNRTNFSPAGIGSERTVDTANNTITSSLYHFSIFTAGVAVLFDMGSEVEVRDDFAYVVGASFFRVFDVSDKMNPALVPGMQFNLDIGFDLALKGDYAFVSDHDYGIRIFNIANPTAVFEEATCNVPLTNDEAIYFDLFGNFLYVTSNNNPLRMRVYRLPATGCGLTFTGYINFTAPVFNFIIDEVDASTGYAVSNNQIFKVENLPVLAGDNLASVSVTASASIGPVGVTGMVARGPYVYLGGDPVSLQVIRKSDLGLQASYTTVLPSTFMRGLAIAGDFAFLPYGISDAVETLDISDITQNNGTSITLAETIAVNNAGAVYAEQPFVYSAGAFPDTLKVTDFSDLLTQPYQLLDDTNSTIFARDVAISGNYAVVGGNNRMVVYEKDASGSFIEHQVITSPPTTYSRVAIFGNTLVGGIISATNPANGSPTIGIVVFERDATGTWAQSQILISPEIQGGDSFGTAFSIDGPYLAVADNNFDHGGRTNAGAVFIFERNALSGQYEFVQRVVNPTPWNNTSLTAVSVTKEGYLVFGERFRKRATVFERDNAISGQGSWVNVPLNFTTGTFNTRFGAQVSIDGDWLAVTDPFSTGTNNARGTVQMFRRDNSGPTPVWNETHVFFISDFYPAITNLSLSFGLTGARLEGDTLLVGAHTDDGGDGTSADPFLDRGSVAVFKRNGNNWAFEQRLQAPAPVPGDVNFEQFDRFGTKVDLTGNTYIISAPDAVGTNGTGAAYILGAEPRSNTYTVGGQLNGLVAGTLDLQLNGSINISLSADGVFTFATAINDGDGYTVTVVNQPPNLICVPANAVGTIAGANVTDLLVSCVSAIPAPVDLGVIGGGPASLAGFIDIAADANNDYYVVYDNAFDPANANLMIDFFDSSSGTTTNIKNELYDGAQANVVIDQLDNLPYISFLTKTPKELTVEKYISGTSWSSLGPIPPLPNVVDMQLAVSPSDGRPWVTRRLGLDIDTVRYNGTSWVDMTGVFTHGQSSFSGNYVLEMAADGRPLLFMRGVLSSIGITKYNFGTSWSFVGDPTEGSVSNVIAMKIDPTDNHPVAAYRRIPSSDGRLQVKKFDGAIWLDYGILPGQQNAFGGLAMVLDVNTGAPFVAYSDSTLGGNIRVLKHTGGTNWLELGQLNSGGSNFAMTIGPNNQPAIAFIEAGAVRLIRFE